MVVQAKPSASLQSLTAMPIAKPLLQDLEGVEAKPERANLPDSVTTFNSSLTRSEPPAKLCKDSNDSREWSAAAEAPQSTAQFLAIV